MDEATARTARLGAATVDWLTARRSAAVIAALDAAGVDHSGIGATGFSHEPMANAGSAGAAMTWVGATIGVPLILSGLTGRVGDPVDLSGEPLTSHDETTIGGQRTVADTTAVFKGHISGSTVIVDGYVTQTSTTTDAQGAVSTGTYRARVRAELEACPDASGMVALHMEVDLSSSTSDAGSFSAHASSVQQGQVGEDAYLQGRTEALDVSQDVTDPSGRRSTGSSRRSVSLVDLPNGGGVDRVVDSSGSVGEGTMDPAESIRWGNFMQMTTFIASVLAYKDAQKAWRGGKCVKVESSEHSRNVAAEDTIHLDATPVHVIDGSHLDKPIVATIAGTQSILPEGTEQPAPASFTYIAGPDIGDKGTVTLTSTSNRGIGTLIIEFTVQPAVVIELEIDSKVIPTLLVGFKVQDGSATATGRIRLEQSAPGHWRGNGTLGSRTRSSPGGCQTVHVAGSGSYGWQVRDVVVGPDVAAGDIVVDMDAGTGAEQPDAFTANACPTTLSGVMNTWENAFFIVYNQKKGPNGLRVTGWTLKATHDTWTYGGLVATANWSGSCPTMSVETGSDPLAVPGLLECTDKTKFRLWAVPAP